MTNPNIPTSNKPAMGKMGGMLLLSENVTGSNVA
jgi:hypothetical protein